MAQLHSFYVLVLVFHALLAGAQQFTVQEEGCPKATRPHMTRCDQYYRCTVLSKDAHVWVATQCQKGLVYLHKLGTCVVPDNDWECDLSAESERNHSDENVYGIDNLNVPGLASNSANSGSEEQSEETQTSRTSKEDRTKSNGSFQMDQNDLESSGDGSGERDEIQTITPLITTTTASTKASGRVTTSTERTSGSLNASQLDSFLAYYDTQNALKLNAKPSPPKMNEQNYLEQLKQIVSQQKQLNEMARIPSNDLYFSSQPAIPVQELIKKKEPETEDTLSKLNLSPGMQEIIKSILDISQKAIANQKQAPAAPVATPQAKEPIVKPILIPISVNPVPVPNVPQAPTTTEQSLKASFPSNYNPTTLGSSSSNWDHGAMPHNALRTNDTNEPQMFHSFPPQQVLYDAYGNSFVPKDAYQPVRASYPSPTYNSYLNPTPQQSSMLINDFPAGSYYSTNSRPSLRVPPSLFSEPLSYLHRLRPAFQRINSPVSDYDDSVDDGYDRLKTPGSIESIEADGNDDLEKDLPLSANRQTDGEQDDSSQEDDDHPTSADTTYKRKLFTLGDATFDYEQYKDSMLPLVDANPNDERISVVLCMVGSRQPNNTDCFRYYICNPHNGAFQSYTCPPLTAFNKNSRMCDLSSYKPCQKAMAPPALHRPLLRTHKPVSAAGSRQQVDQIKHELRKAQKYVEMIRLEANRLRRRNGASSPSSSSGEKVILLPSLADHRGPAAPSKGQLRKESAVKKKASTAKQPARKVPRCRLEGRMPDPMDKSNYYVCHRKSPNKFIKLKMACPADLLYCADTQYCTLRTNC
uniref:Chitin-binding type-2 domain-containing protein n=1 Tax=Anopheles gambiae TaxID=7165 RepID=A0A1S4HD19_ANOGA